MRRALLALMVLGFGLCVAAAHEVRPAYLEVLQTSADTYNILWKVPGRGGELRLALYVQLPTGSIEVSKPQGLFVNNAFIERWSVRREGGFAGGIIRIAGLDTTLTDALVRVQRLDGSVQVARLTPASPSFVIVSAPGSIEVAATYLKLGFEHILLGYDHLLFLLALIMIVRGARMMVATVTAFTVAHSVTLALAALSVVYVPRPPVEAAIALSIMFVASEGLRLWHGRVSLTAQYPWIVAFVFGLLHGFGFASALIDIGLPQGDVPLSLFAFNLGVEFGQLTFVAALFAAASLAARIGLQRLIEKCAQPLVTYGVGSLATFWFLERLSAFTL